MKICSSRLAVEAGRPVAQRDDDCDDEHRPATTQIPNDTTAAPPQWWFCQFHWTIIGHRSSLHSHSLISHTLILDHIAAFSRCSLATYGHQTRKYTWTRGEEVTRRHVWPCEPLLKQTLNGRFLAHVTVLCAILAQLDKTLDFDERLLIRIDSKRKLFRHTTDKCSTSRQSLLARFLLLPKDSLSTTRSAEKRCCCRLYHFYCNYAHHHHHQRQQQHHHHQQ